MKLLNGYTPKVEVAIFGGTTLLKRICLCCGDGELLTNDPNPSAFCPPCLKAEIFLRKWLKKNPPEKEREYEFDLIGSKVAQNLTIAKTRRTGIGVSRALKRDDYTCQYCGYSIHDFGTVRALHVDHISPVVVGGRNTPDNLVTACQPCNGIAGSKIFDSFEAKRAYIVGRMVAKRKWIHPLVKKEFRDIMPPKYGKVCENLQKHRV